MTLSVAWVRQVRKTEELLIATDSRLRFGMAWDCCPKIVPLARGDSAVCFAGDTKYAYPMMLQMFNAVAMHRKSRSRAQDITDLRGHFLRVLENMRAHIHDLPNGNPGDIFPDALFILAGYSWKLRGFRIWALHYKPSEDRFVFRSASGHRKKTDGTKYFHFVGDHTTEATLRVYALLDSRGRLTKGNLDMEPFEVLRDMIRDNVSPSIGGPPQLIKIYPHMNTLPFSIYWPNKAAGTLTYLGRPLLAYEAPEFLSLDPDTLLVEETDFTKLVGAQQGAQADGLASGEPAT